MRPLIDRICRNTSRRWTRFRPSSARSDRERSTAESERAILEGLRWLGTEWDEGPEVGGPHAPYHQSERIELHRAAGGVGRHGLEVVQFHAGRVPGPLLP